MTSGQFKKTEITNRKRTTLKSNVRIINKKIKFNGNISSLFQRHRQTDRLTYNLLIVSKPKALQDEWVMELTGPDSKNILRLA